MDSSPTRLSTPIPIPGAPLKPKAQPKASFKSDAPADKPYVARYLYSLAQPGAPRKQRKSSNTSTCPSLKGKSIHFSWQL